MSGHVHLMCAGNLGSCVQGGRSVCRGHLHGMRLPTCYTWMPSLISIGNLIRPETILHPHG